MKAAIMQPYFLPYTGYFQLMHHVDLWVTFDDIKFIDKGWINRNRILHPEDEKCWQYITIPLKKKHNQSKINEIEINDSKDWRNSIKGKLSHYRKRKAPYYYQGEKVLERCLEKQDTNLSSFIKSSLSTTKEALGISTPLIDQPKISTDKEASIHAGSWALEICKSIGANHYINPIGGRHLFSEEEYKKEGIEIAFLSPNLKPYAQNRKNFEPGLSIIDTIMWLGLKETSKIIKEDFRIVRGQP